MRKPLLTCGLLLFFIPRGVGQYWSDDNWGVQLGLSAQFGTHIQQIGIKLQAFYTQSFIQLNTGYLIHFNNLNLGARSNYLESRINIGAVLLGGKRDAIPTFILDGLNHQTAYRYGWGYNYLWYIDQAGTSQRSGGMAFHLAQWSLLLENDFYGGQGKDRFRTSHAQLNYHTENVNFSINTHLWTGETGGVRRQENGKYSAQYKDISSNHLGKTSHGIAHVGIDYHFIFGNVLSLDAGYDHERIRHILQNRLMHDKKFVPQKIRKVNPHYPMLDVNGEPSLNGEDVKPGKIMLQIGSNRNLTY
jgi:hypothetical protein